MDRVKLLDMLKTNFDDAELREICFNLNIDYEELPGQAKGAKARELITHLERRGRLVELANLCQKERPHLDWPGVENASGASQSDQASLETQIRHTTRRLNKLRETKAFKGINTEPEILLEIEDLEAELTTLLARRQGGA